MLRWNLMKRALPMALSLCLTVQSVPNTAYASEHLSSEITQASVEESADAETEEAFTEASVEDAEEESEATSADVTESVDSSSEESTDVSKEETAEETAEETSSEESADASKEGSENPSYEEESEAESEAVEETVQTAEAVNTAAEDVMALVLNADAVEIALPANSSSTGKWFQFTAAETGYYTFYVKGSDYNNIYLDEYDDIDGNWERSKDGTKYQVNEYLEADQTVYFKMYSYSSSESTVTISVKNALVATLTSTEGVYTAATDTLSVDITPEVGYKDIAFDVELKVKSSSGSSSDSYRVDVDYRYEGNSYTYDTQISLSGSSSDDGNLTYSGSRDIKYLAMNSSYIVTMSLVNNTTGELICVLVPDTDQLKLKTNTTTEKIVVSDPDCSYNSITLNYNAISNVYEIGYAPTDCPDEEQYTFSYSYGKSSTKITKLDSGTEYTFTFYDNDYAELGKTTASTIDFPGTVTYTVDAASDKAGTITITASAADCLDSVNYLLLFADVLDAEGNSVWPEDMNEYQSMSQTDYTYNYSITREISGLEANTNYTVKVWLQESSYSSDSKYAQKEYMVTTAKAEFTADAISFKATQDADTATTANYTIAVDNYTGSVSGSLKYRPKGSGETYATNSISLTGGSCSGTLTKLQAGTEYEIILLVGGVRKELTYTHGKAAYTPVMTSNTDENGAFGFQLTFQLPEEQVNQNVTYTAKPEYWNGSNYLALNNANNTGYQSLNADNNYTFAFNTYTDYNYGSDSIRPDTEYVIRWAMQADGTDTTYYYTSVHTEKSSVTAKQTAIYVNRAEYEVSLAGFPEVIPSSTSYSLSCYVKEGDGNFRASGSSLYLQEYNSLTQSFTMKGLKDDTDYTVSVRDSEGREYGSFTFTTPKDDRTVTLDSETPYKNRFNVYVKLAGTNMAYSNYLHFYYREKGKTEWNHSYNSFYSENISSDFSFSAYSYDNESLKEGTEYEYIIGISNSYNDSVEDLLNTITGVVTTLRDMRTVTASESHGYTYATFNIKVDGGTSSDYGYWYLYYRIKGATDWEKASYNYVGSSTQTSYTLTGLNPGTEYEYAVALSDWGLTTPDSIAEGDKKVLGSFTTNTASFKLTFTPNESESTYNKEVLTVKAQVPEDETATLYVNVTLSDGQKDAVTLKKIKDYEGKVSFTGLKPETQYSISGLSGTITEKVNNTKYDVVVDLSTDTAAFTTAKAEVPASIAFAEKELKLNLSYDVNGVEVKTTAAPASAAPEVVLSSADESIAKIENGKVVPVGVGETTITAASAYDEKVTAECTVTVKNYVLGQTTDGVATKYSDTSITLYKGDTLANIGYYEESTGDSGKILTPLSDYTVTSSKPGVADWSKENQAVLAIQTGYKAELTFDKDGYKTSITVTVQPKAKAFGITGLTTTSSYPAIDKGDGTYEIVYSEGVTYTAKGEITPSETFYASDYAWASSDETVATVTNGQITPKSAGQAVITVTANEEGKFTDISKVTFTLNVKELPSTSVPTVYAVTNVQKTLKEVAFPASMGEGWSWKYPATPLYSLPVNSDGYYFEAVYTGDTYYAYEGTVLVKISTITGVGVTEGLGSADYYHNGVLLADGTDEITINVAPIYTGDISSGVYTTNVTSKKQDVTVTKNENGTWSVKASKAGKYTLDTQIAVNGTVVAKGSYTITAVDESPISTITLSTDTEGITIQNNLISLDLSEKSEKGTISLSATAVDRKGIANTTTKLEWKSTDKSVATVTADKTDSRKAVVQVKGEGHTVIQVTAKDAAGVSTQLDLEIQNHQPRVNTSKATVNMAFDYDDYNGMSLSQSLYGSIEIVPVYDENISNYTVYEGESISQNFSLYSYGSNTYVVVPKKDEIKNGTYTCTMKVTTSTRNTYSYPLKVTVINKKPKVTAKVSGSMNLFYVDDDGTLDITLEKSNYSVQSVTWDDGVNDASNGFSLSSYWWSVSGKPTLRRYSVYQTNVKVKDGKLVDSNIASGTLKVKLYGVKDTYEFKNIKIKYNYKKPTLKAYDATTGKNVSSILPTMDSNDFRIYVVNKTTKSWLYNDETSTRSNAYGEVTVDNQDVDISFKENAYYLYLSYNGTKSQEKFTLTFYSDNWRDSLKVTHSVKAVQPKAVLSNVKLTYNTAYMNQVTSYIRLSGYCDYLSLTDVEIKGADSKSQALLDDDRLQITHDGAYVIYSRLNKVKLAGQTAPNGTYTYNLTPYYTDGSGSRVALNTVKMKITFTDKAITAKTTGKGTIDLTKLNSYYNNAVVLTDKFTNLGTNYYMSDRKLVGEYSDYFTLTYSSYYGKYCIRANGTGELKAGQSYNLQVVYTIRTSSNETIQVTGNVFKVKPKQTAAKVTVSNNNQTLYAGASSLTRSYYISVPYGYTINGVSGSVDVNKDGTADITVSKSSSGNGYAYLTVKITDQDAVLATTKGKTYSIPVTVRMSGRDGIAKDSTVSIKVTVKR